jgi:hypothetical protein
MLRENAHAVAEDPEKTVVAKHSDRFAPKIAALFLEK